MHHENAPVSSKLAGSRRGESGAGGVTDTLGNRSRGVERGVGKELEEENAEVLIDCTWGGSG